MLNWALEFFDVALQRSDFRFNRNHDGRAV